MNDIIENKLPLITIGIPNYNYGQYIVKSLESAVRQTYTNIEILIVDDCSNDDSIIILEEWIKNYDGIVPIKLFKQPKNIGLTKVCNCILNNAQGTYLQILDADDIFKADKLLNQFEIIKGDENIALVYSNMTLIDHAGEILNKDYLRKIGYDETNMPSGRIFEELFEFNFIAYPLIRLSLARKVGGFDESQQVHDYYLWLKLAEKYEIRYCPGNYAYYRIHESSMSNSEKTNIVSLENVLNTKYRYYCNGTANIKKIVKRDIYNSITTLYKSNYPNTELWLKRNYKLNPGIKSFTYYLLHYLGIPYNFLNFLKNILKTKPS